MTWPKRLFERSSEPEPEDGYSLRKGIADIVDAEMKRQHIKGMGMIVFGPKEVIFEDCFGFADQNNDRRVGPRTVFRAGSVSKLVTAVATMQLVERGIIQLDDALKDHLPDFSMRRRFQDPTPVTIRHLLSHHAGLPISVVRGYQLDPETGTDDEDSYLQLLEELDGEYLLSPPGSQFLYTNLAMCLLGILVTRMSGMPLSEYARRNIFEPLGMKSSSFLERDMDEGELSKSYRGDNELPDYRIRDLPAGNLYSTTEDLMAFARMFLLGGEGVAKGVLSRETIEEMLRVQNGGCEVDWRIEMGLGFWLSHLGPDERFRVACHGGDINEFHSFLAVLPSEDIGIVLLANSSVEGSDGISVIARQVLSLVLGLEPREEPTGPPRTRGTWKDGSLDPREVEGVYATSVGPLDVRIRRGHLRIKIRMGTIRLLPVGGMDYGMQVRLFDMFPIRSPFRDGDRIYFHKTDGRTLMYGHSGMTSDRLGERVEPGEVHEDWLGRTGTYLVVNPDAIPRIGRVKLFFNKRNGFLTARVRVTNHLKDVEREIDLILSSVSNDEAVFLGDCDNSGEGIRAIHTKGGEVLRLYGYELRKRRRSVSLRSLFNRET